MLGEERTHGRRLANGQLPPHLDDAMKEVFAEEGPNVRCETLILGQFAGSGGCSGVDGRRPREELDVTFQVDELRGGGRCVNVAFKHQLELPSALPADARMHLLLRENYSPLVCVVRGERGAESHPELQKRSEVET
jgi:hypothetical protein